MTRHLVVAAALGVLSASCTVHVDTEERIAREEKRFTISGEPDVRVYTFDGGIEVRSWDRDEVLVEVEKRGPDEDALKSMQVRAEQRGNRIDIEVTGPSRESFQGIGFHRSSYARLVVTVPRKLTLQARSGDGSIRAGRLDGRIELRSGDGSVRVSEVRGHLDVETADGSIGVEDVEGEMALTTRDGGISVAGRLGAVRAKTGDGSVTIRADRGSAMTADWSITTEDGTVAVYLPEEFAAELDAQTGDGRVRSDFDVQVTTTANEGDQERRRRSLRGKIGAGGRLMRIRTGDGSITLRNW
ncbi:MAG TPA: DUF4097 family beta strand repeat-containing protein [Vicinamibacterales bacterium]|nr:DUF4097 family beta strand repeat-containing protein [Vicinamibacterales bacterium]